MLQTNKKNPLDNALLKQMLKTIWHLDCHSYPSAEMRLLQLIIQLPATLKYQFCLFQKAERDYMNQVSIDWALCRGLS